MYSRLNEQLARQRHAELAAKTERRIPPCLRKRPRHPGPSLRSSAGWAIVAIGLRIAESGTQRTPVAAANHCR